MKLTIIANHPSITGITVNAGIFLDEEADQLYISNPLNKPMPLAFFKTEPISLFFEGDPIESLELSPKTLVALIVDAGEIFIKEILEGEVRAIPMVAPVTLNPTNFYNFDIDSAFFQSKEKSKRFTLKQMKTLYATELERIETELY
jgi:hypothetical protein